MNETTVSGVSPRAVLTLAVAAVVLLTAALALLPGLDYAYRAPELQIALNTADAVIAVVVAYLVLGRYQVRNRARDLLLTCSLLALAAANLPLAALPLGGPEHLEAWAGLVARSVGALLLGAAALVPRSLRVAVPVARRAVLGTVLVGAWIAALVLTADVTLTQPVPPFAELDPGRPWVGGHPFVLVLQSVSLLMYVVAAWAFARSAVRERDEFLLWVAAAAVLSAGARLNYLAFPSLYTEHLYTGDVLRLGFYLLLLVGGAREMRSYWTARVVAAVARGRTDSARELGDLLLPPLRELAERTADAEVRRDLRALTERAERAISTERENMEPVLAAEPFEAALRAALVPLALPRGTTIDVRADVVVAPEEREQLLSLAVDAAALASGAGASVVRLTLVDEPRRLIVQAEGTKDALSPVARAELVQRLRARAAQSRGEVGLVSLDPPVTAVTIDWL